jgi:hypothetical protein
MKRVFQKPRVGAQCEQRATAFNILIDKLNIYVGTTLENDALLGHAR